MAKAKLPPPASSKEEAIRLGLLSYVSPKPCARAHSPTIRYLKSGHCVDCRHLQYKVWHAEHPDAQPGYALKYYKANYDALYAVAAARIKANRPEANAIQIRWRRKNPDAWKSILQRNAQKHPEKRTEHSHRRRSLKAGSAINFTAKDIRFIIAAQGRACAYCWKPIIPKTWAADHFQPLCREGSNGPENIVMTCRPCNLRKGARLPEKFLEAERKNLIIVRVSHPNPDRLFPLLPLIEFIDEMLHSKGSKS